MAFFDLLAKGAKAFVITNPVPGNVKVLDVPKLIQQDGNEVIDPTSEWIVVGYQFNGGPIYVPQAAIVAGSFFFEDGPNGKALSPIHYWNQVYASPLVESLFRCGLGKPLYIQVTGGFSGVVYVWDPNYSNSRRSNF